MRALLPVVLLAACTITNPLFDVASTGDQGTGDASSGDTGTSTTAPTTGETGGSTHDPSVPTTGDTTGDTTGGTTEGLTSDGSSTAITVSTGDTTGDTTTGEPAGCWAQGADGWPLDGMPLNNFADAAPVDPFITPDGLGLYYVAGNPRRPFLSTRADLGDPFPNGIQQALWGNDPAIVTAHPTAVLGGKELLFLSQFDVYTAKAGGNVPNVFGLPVPLSPPGTGGPEIKITATADSATVIVARRDGPLLPPFFPGPSDRFYQYERAKLEPGAAYAGGNDVTPVVGKLGLAICPTLSADGLHLFFGSTESDAPDANAIAAAVAIYYTSRPDPSGPWATAKQIAIAHPGPEVVCPSSVTADGCQLVFHRFGLGDPPSYSMYLAKRTP